MAETEMPRVLKPNAKNIPHQSENFLREFVISSCSFGFGAGFPR